MKKLLPDSIQTLKAVHRRDNSAAKAERLASNDPEYLDLIHRYITIFQRGLEARIQLETHRMLLSARQTMRGFQKF